MDGREWERAVAEALALREAAENELRVYPAVHSVGVGLRDREGCLERELVFRAYVEAKRPRDQQR